MKEKSKYICAYCGVAVGAWARGKNTYWKHQAGRGEKSCGKEPRVMTRQDYEKSINDMLDAATDFGNRK